MNGAKKGLIMAVAGAFLVAGCDSTASSDLAGIEAAMEKSDNAPVHMASGGGTVDVPTGGRSTYTFHASANGAGDVSGAFNIHFSTIDAHVSGDVTCLLVIPNVLGGSAALLTGVVTSSSDETLMAVGTKLHWQALDRGEGNNALEDMVSPFASVTQAPGCGFLPPMPITEFTNGNVQIK
jgi:hypothetical protein